MSNQRQKMENAYNYVELNFVPEKNYRSKRVKFYAFSVEKYMLLLL